MPRVRRAAGDEGELSLARLGAGEERRRVGTRRPRQHEVGAPFSSTRPAYITTTRLQSPGIWAMSWVMSRSAAPVSSASRRIRSSTWIWIVTSRPDVGSSAITSSGRQVSAIAIIARCAMPPEYSCG